VSFYYHSFSSINITFTDGNQLSESIGTVDCSRNHSSFHFHTKKSRCYSLSDNNSFNYGPSHPFITVIQFRQFTLRDSQPPGSAIYRFNHPLPSMHCKSRFFLSLTKYLIRIIALIYRTHLSPHENCAWVHSQTLKMRTIYRCHLSLSSITFVGPCS
jgi:hypothetical protein